MAGYRTFLLASLFPLGLSGRAAAQCPSVEWLRLEELRPFADSADRTLFGNRVVASGEQLFVLDALQEAASVSGVARILRADAGPGGNWSLVGTRHGASLDSFLQPLAADGELFVLGDTASMGTGAVSVFERDLGGVGNFGLRALVHEAGLDPSSDFGSSVALRGDTLFVATPSASVGDEGVWLYRRNQGGPDQWGRVDKVWEVGGTLALEGESLLIGGGNLAGSAGVVFVLGRDQGGPDQWGLVRQLRASDGVAGDLFGASVALSGTFALVGAPGRDEGAFDTGAAYVFERDAGGPSAWGEVQKLVASDRVETDDFGRSVALAGDLAAVGAPLQDATDLHSGAVYLFARDAGGAGAWGQIEKLVPPSTVGARLGTSVQLANGRLFAGGTRRAYVFGSGAPAAATFRTDSGGVSAPVYVAGPPVLGEVFAATVALASTGHTLARLFVRSAPAETTLPGGQVLLVGGTALFASAPLAGPTAVFHFELPPDPVLCGFTCSTQAMLVGGAPPFALSNARDLVIGTGF